MTAMPERHVEEDRIGTRKKGRKGRGNCVDTWVHLGRQNHIVIGLIRHPGQIKRRYSETATLTPFLKVLGVLRPSYQPLYHILFSEFETVVSVPYRSLYSRVVQLYGKFIVALLSSLINQKIPVCIVFGKPRLRALAWDWPHLCWCAAFPSAGKY